ncbi:hypothetical protein [Neobacillus soli]|uniref:hypothetical protein n=1 Tax=Neobacillus soli TaxID=220688 RepID=UPI0008245BB7|nr:hypothetical protein [Neobacillus soli]
MGNKKYTEMMQKYNEEADSIKESYKLIKENMLMEYEEIKKRFDAVDGIIQKVAQGEDHLDEQTKKEQVSKDEALVYISKKLEEIEQYEKNNLRKVLAKQKEIKGKFEKELTVEITKQKYKLMKAKYDFLAAAIALREEHKTIIHEEYLHQKLKSDLEFQPDGEFTDAFKALSSAIVNNGAAVSNEELHQALHSGQLPEGLEKEVKLAEEKGFI